MKQSHVRMMKQMVKRELEKPLPDILSVMAVCNRAHFERSRHLQKRVSTQRALEQVSREMKVSARQTKKFTVM